MIRENHVNEPDIFCPQCGPMRHDASSAIDEDGCCRYCGATTCTWPDLVEHLKDEGFELRRDPMLQFVEGYSKAYAALDETGKRVVDAQLDKAIESQLCRHDGFSHTRNVDCPPKVNPAWLGMVERAAADAEELGVSSLNPMCLTPQAEKLSACECSPDYLWECGVPGCPAKK